MNKKLITQIAIGAGALILVYLLYKKFMAKPAETKSAETDETLTDSATSASTEAATPTKENKNFKQASLTTITGSDAISIGGSDKLFMKFGISQADYDKMMDKRREIKKSLSGIQDVQQRKTEAAKQLKAFADANNISYGAFTKAMKAKEVKRSKESESNQFAGFMDIHANEDVLGSVM